MRENPLINILFNIALPALVLNKFPSIYKGEDSALYALIIGISFPIIYGVWDFIDNKKINYISLLGLLGTLFTGGFALMKLDGEWFAYKEAFPPFLIGLFVLASAWSKKPFINMMLMNPKIMKTHLIDEKLDTPEKKSVFNYHLKISTIFLSFSFFLSSFLNYYLATKTFTKIDLTLPELEQKQLLNEQIASMTVRSFVVIMIPSMIALIFVLWYLLSGIKKQTELTLDDLIVHEKKH